MVNFRLAHTHSLMYNRELTITLVYKYKVKFKNRRVLIKVFRDNLRRFHCNFLNGSEKKTYPKHNVKRQ